MGAGGSVPLTPAEVQDGDREETDERTTPLAGSMAAVIVTELVMIISGEMSGRESLQGRHRGE